MAIIEAVGTRVLRPTGHTPRTRIEDVEFHGRPTIGIVVIYDRNVLFVKPRAGRHCIIPQGGIERPQDKTFLDAAYREGRQELNLEERHFKKGQEHILLGEFLNPIPIGRGISATFKHLFLMVVPVWYSDWVRLNRENQKFVWVGSEGALMTLIGKMRAERPVKFWGIVNAIDEMGKRGIIPWKSGLGTAG